MNSTLFYDSLEVLLASGTVENVVKIVQYNHLDIIGM